ncbi:amidase domain-containing protein [Paenibacillus pasadenensis]|uniref:amidase domain-containing protein n=1 Tax=Paenibacillus pasadenensis TaxID=217090 RepID=UPI0020415A49|nr:amidase domain-containing protein [Paenibacillus pasadenensis]MCM3748427.1 amidase domain-containing protein [Paenibacillus pasadenensis]
MPRIKVGKKPPAAAEQRNTEPEGWRGAVQRYVNGCNQAELELRDTALAGIMADADHRLRLLHRLQRLRDRYEERGILTSHCETKASIVKINEAGSEVSVVLQLHLKRHVEHQGRNYMEERIERERLWLTSDGSEGAGWKLTRIEPVVGERRPRYGPSAADIALAENRSFGSGWGSNGQNLGVPQPFLNHGVVPRVNTRSRAVKYRRELAAAYADQWWKDPNPAYEEFDVNCTNYVSQCVFAGEAPMNYTGKRESGWWYKGRSGGQELWSYSWAVSNSLQMYLSFPRSSGMRATAVESAAELSLGDVIAYDWNGDGRFQHTTIVTAFDGDGMPLVNANTVPSRHRYWDYKDSYAWTEHTRYRFFHLNDTM